MMSRSNLGPARALALVSAAMVVVVGCGAFGGSDPDEATTSLTAPTTPTTVFVPTGADDDEGETIVDLETRWAADRAALVAELGVSQFGVDEVNVLNGPGRLTVDLDGCPAEWSDTAGLEGDTIRIGLTVAQSGDFASFNDTADGMRAYFDYVNANGGVDGKSIELVVRDDAYDAAVTATVVQTMLAEDNPFYLTNVGSPGALTVYDDLNDACVPQPFVVSAHPAWGDPSDHPFTSGLQLSYTTEAILWGTWIKRNLGDQIPVTVGALVTDNDFGQVYLDAFTTWADGNPDVVSEVISIKHDPTIASVATEMAELADADPAVFVSMTAGDPCVSAVREAQVNGLTLTAAALFTPSVCREPAVYMEPAGDAGNGFIVVGSGLKSTVDPVYADETFVRFVIEQLTAAGLDPANNLVGVGFAQYGWAHVELLRTAAALPGGLTRSNVVLAMRSLDLDHPMLLEGVRFVSDGLSDAFLVEGGEYSRYDATAGAWFQTGPAVDVNGSTPSCRWTRSVCEN